MGTEPSDVLLDSSAAAGKPLRRGKVRDIYEAGPGRLLIVASDRISAYDVVLPNGVPDKGRVLTQISAFWFRTLESLGPHHLISTSPEDFPEALGQRRAALAGRSMLVREAKPFPVECVARGYLTGSAWREYRQSGRVAGEKLPAGLADGARLEQPIFTPSTKAETGHDENIAFDQMAGIVGAENAAKLRDRTLSLFRAASEIVASRGLVLVDTKFEFGVADGAILLIDEALTPDSSRFWEAGDGRRVSFDKQFVRDWLDASGWDHTPPAPELPPEIVEKTRDLYVGAFRRITGRELARGG